jgi:DNA-binding transcriptional LysR family regulator
MPGGSSCSKPQAASLAGDTPSLKAFRPPHSSLTHYHQTLRQHFEAAGVPAPRMQAMGTIEGVKRGILAGGTALGLLPEHAVEPELRDSVLVEVRVSPALPCVVLRAVLAPGAVRSPVVDDLIDALRGSPRRGLLLTAAAEAVGDQRRARPRSR